MLSVVALIAGWWYVRNVELYGDLFRQHAEAQLLAFLPGFNDYHVGAVEYWRAVGISAFAMLPGFYRDWLPWPVYAVYGFLAAAGIYAILRCLRRPKLEWTLLAIPVLLAGAIWALYNYHHFMPSLRIVYAVISIPCLVAARSLVRIPTWITILVLLACSMLTVIVMPNRWISPNAEPAFRHVIMPFRPVPFPTSPNLQ